MTHIEWIFWSCFLCSLFHDLKIHLSILTRWACGHWCADYPRTASRLCRNSRMGQGIRNDWILKVELRQFVMYGEGRYGLQHIMCEATHQDLMSCFLHFWVCCFMNVTGHNYSYLGIQNIAVYATSRKRWESHMHQMAAGTPETKMYWAPEQSTGQILWWMNHLLLFFMYLTDS